MSFHRPVLGHFMLLGLAVFASSALGCMASEPTTNQKGTVPNAVSPDMALPPDMTPSGPVAPPVLNGLPTTSQYLQYKLNGIATAGNTVIIEGTATGSISAEVDTSGTFCVVVQLNASATTNMTLYAVDPNGNQSTTVTFSVTQTGTPPSQGMAQPSVNAALSGTGSATFTFTTGDESLMHDGDPDTFIEGSESGTFTTTDNVTMTLDQTYLIKTINIMAPASCALVAPFTLYISDSVPTTTAGPGAAGWTAVSSTLVTPSDATDTNWVVNFPNPPNIQAISLYFDRDIFPTTAQLNCGTRWVGDAVYAISEIEAWTVAGLAPAPIGAPSCGD